MSIRKGDTVIAGREQGATYTGVIHDATLSGAGTQADPLSVVQPDIYHPSLFDYKYADYRLDEVSWLRSETFSWQNARIYEAAFNHLKADMEDRDTVQYTLPYKNNVYLYSNCQANTKSELSGFFSAMSYANHPAKTPTYSWEYQVCFTTPGSWANEYSIFGATSGYEILLRPTTAGVSRVWMSSNNSSWDIASAYRPGFTFSLNTKQWFKIIWDGSTYNFYYSTNGTDWTTGTALSSTARPYFHTGLLSFGKHAAETNTVFNNGIIHLDQCYMKVDGQLYWKGTDSITYYHSSDNHNIVDASEVDKVAEYFRLYKCANFFVYDGENKRFKLPRKGQRRLIKAHKTNTYWFNLYSDGWVEQGGNFGSTDANYRQKPVSFPIKFQDTSYTFVMENGHTSDTYNTAVWDKRTHLCYAYVYNGQGTANWHAEGYAADDALSFSPEKEYYYMGYFTPTALANTGSLLEGLNNKMDNDMGNLPNNVDFVIESWSDGTNWYRLYRSGWLEQGGTSGRTTDTMKTIIFQKAFSSIPTIIITRRMDGTGDLGTSTVDRRGVFINNTTPLSFDCWDAWSSSKSYLFWEAKGYAAQ